MVAHVMLRGGFGKRVGYLVIVASFLTLFSPFGVIMTNIPVVIPFIGLVLTGIWQLLVGAKLDTVGKNAEGESASQRTGEAKEKSLITPYGHLPL